MYKNQRYLATRSGQITMIENTAENSETRTKGLGRNFRFMSLNTAISRAGSSVFALSVVWMTLILTSSPVIAGFADGMVSFPLFMSFVFGAYIDGLRTKKTLAILATAIRAFSVLILIVAIFYDILWVRILAIYTVSFLLGMTSDILNTIRASWSKQFLEEKQYKSGMSLLESVTSVAQGIGYLLSGAFLILGLIPAVYGMTAIFMLALIPLFLIKDNDATISPSADRLASSILSGLRYIRKSNMLKAIIIIMLLVNFAFGTVSIFFAYLVQYTFKLTAIYYSLLFVAIVLGIITGSIIASRIKGKVGFYNLIFLFSTGVLLASMRLFSSIYPEYLLVYIIGVMIGLVNVISETAVLTKIDREMMGRVSGAFSTFALAATFLSGGIGGVLIHFFTLPWSFVIVGSVIAAVALMSSIFKDYYNLRV